MVLVGLEVGVVREVEAVSMSINISTSLYPNLTGGGGPPETGGRGGGRG